jgi:hypothetical protein
MILTIILAAASAGLLCFGKTKKPTPLIFPVGATLFALLAILSRSLPERDEADDLAKKISELRDFIPLEALSTKIGGTGKVAILAEADSRTGEVGTATESKIAAWQKKFPNHEFHLIASKAEILADTIDKIAKKKFTGVVILSSFQSTHLESLIQGEEGSRFACPVLCLDLEASQKMIPLIRTGTIFAGIRSTSRSIQTSQNAEDAELFRLNFELLTASNASPTAKAEQIPQNNHADDE